MKNIDALKSLSKFCDQNSPRNYASVIGFVDGKFYLTDGFMLIEFTPFEGDDSYPLPTENLSLRPDLISTSSVRFPSVGGIINNYKAKEKIEEPSVEIIRKLLKRIKPQRTTLAIELKATMIGPSGLNLNHLATINKILPKGAGIDEMHENEDLIRFSIEPNIKIFCAKIIA